MCGKEIGEEEGKGDGEIESGVCVSVRGSG